MNGLFATRNMFVGLALLAGVLAVLVAWLLTSGRVDAPSLFAAREKPAASTEKPAAPAQQQQSAVNSATETLKGLTDQLATTPKQDEAKPATDALTPTFDIARIEPNGEAVIAGRASPGASVELLQDGKVHDRTVADASGAFVFVPQPLPSGRYDLTLRATGKDGQPARSSAPVAVTVDVRAADKAVTALAVTPPALAAKPGDAIKPADTLKPSDALKSNDAKAGAAASVQIDAVTAGEGGKLRVLGRATPGAVVKLHLNDAYIASATAAPDGRVDFSILDGVKPGEYRVRLDQTGAGGNVVARIERMFEAPVALAATPSPAPQQDAAAAKQETPSPLATGSTDQANVVVVPKINTKVVLRGDNLWRISQATYGHGKSYTKIYSANRNQIRNPNLIFPDQIFVLPSAAE